MVHHQDYDAGLNVLKRVMDNMVSKTTQHQGEEGQGADSPIMIGAPTQDEKPQGQSIVLHFENVRDR